MDKPSDYVNKNSVSSQAPSISVETFLQASFNLMSAEQLKSRLNKSRSEERREEAAF